MALDPTSTRVSRYLEYLPAIFQEDPFIGQFLLAFERILTGRQPPDDRAPYPEQKGLEEYVDRLYTYLTPGPASSELQAQEEFLPWLASWVAVSLRDDWSVDFKRQFISNMVFLYRRRGTKEGLMKLLELYTTEGVAIAEFDRPAFYFQVSLTLGNLNEFKRKETIARALIDREKPAHTFYNLQFLIPTMQINNTYYWPEDATKENWREKEVTGLRVGWNTILGTIIYLGSP